MFRTDAEGALVCPHRDLSCCDACFAATPNLISVFSTVYPWNAGFGFSADEVAAILAAGPGADMHVSPGTVS